MIKSFDDKDDISSDEEDTSFALSDQQKWNQYVQVNQKLVDQLKNQLEKKGKELQKSKQETDLMLGQKNTQIKELKKKLQILTWQNQIDRQKIQKFKLLSETRKESLDDVHSEASTDQIIKSLQKKKIQSLNELDTNATNIEDLKPNKESSDLHNQVRQMKEKMLADIISGVQAYYSQSNFEQEQFVKPLIAVINQKQKVEINEKQKLREQSAALKSQVVELTEKLQALEEEIIKEKIKRKQQKQNCIEEINDAIEKFFRNGYIAGQYKKIQATLEKKIQQIREDAQSALDSIYGQKMSSIFDSSYLEGNQNVKQCVSKIYIGEEAGENKKLPQIMEKSVLNIKKYIEVALSKKQEEMIEEQVIEEEQEDDEIISFTMENVLEILNTYITKIQNRRLRYKAKFIINEKLAQLIDC